MKNVLVTGAHGFIGSNLCRKMGDEGFTAFAPTIEVFDVSDKHSVMEYGLRHQIEHVVHLAAKTFVPESWSKTVDYFTTNLLGTVNILEFCRAYSCNLTFVSSYLYGNPIKIPISEDAELHSNNPYALTKKLAEETCQFYSDNYQIKICILRPFNIYGPGQSDRFLLPKIIMQILGDTDYIEVMNLLPKRDYLYIDDLVDAIIASFHMKTGLNAYNVGSGESYSVKEIIDRMQIIAGTNKQIRSENMIRKNEVMDVVADNSKIRLDFGWIPHYSIDEGLKRYISIERGELT